MSRALLCLVIGLAWAYAAQPVALAPPLVTTPEDTEVAILLRGDDADGDRLTFSIVDLPDRGQLFTELDNDQGREALRLSQVFSGTSTGAVTVWYRPPADQNDASISNTRLGDFRFVVNDGTNGSPAVDVRVSVTPVDDPVRLVAPIPTQLVGRGTVFEPLNYFNRTFSQWFHDPDLGNGGDIITYDLTVTGQGEVPTWIDFDPTTARISIGQFSMDAEITVTASDAGSGTTASGTFTLISRPQFTFAGGDWDAPTSWRRWDDGTEAYVVPAAPPGANDLVWLNKNSGVQLPAGQSRTIGHLIVVDWATITGPGTLVVSGQTYTRTRGGGGLSLVDVDLDLANGFLQNRPGFTRGSLIVRGRVDCLDGLGLEGDTPVTVIAGGHFEHHLARSHAGFMFRDVTNFGTLSLLIDPADASPYGAWRNIDNHATLVWTGQLNLTKCHLRAGSTVRGQGLALVGNSVNVPADKALVETALEVDWLSIENSHRCEWNGVPLSLGSLSMKTNARLVRTDAAPAGPAPVRTPPGHATIVTGSSRLESAIIDGDVRLVGHRNRLVGHLQGPGTLTVDGNTRLGELPNSGQFVLEKALHHDGTSSFIHDGGSSPLKVYAPLSSWSLLDAMGSQVEIARGLPPVVLRGLRLWPGCTRFALGRTGADTELHLQGPGVLSAVSGDTPVVIDTPLSILVGVGPPAAVVRVDPGVILSHLVVRRNDGSILIDGGELRLGSTMTSAPSGTGTWHLDHGGTLTPPSGLPLRLEAGALRGDGNVAGSVALAGSALLEPHDLGAGFGFDPATIHVQGDLELGPGTTTRFDLGPGPDPFESIAVDGNLVLAGTLAVGLVDGTSPTPGLTVRLFQAGSTSGTFAALVPPAVVPGARWRTRVEATATWLDLATVVRRLGIRANVASDAVLLPATTGASDGADGWIFDGLSPDTEYRLQLTPQPAPAPG